MDKADHATCPDRLWQKKAFNPSQDYHQAWEDSRSKRQSTDRWRKKHPLSDDIEARADSQVERILAASLHSAPIHDNGREEAKQHIPSPVATSRRYDESDCTIVDQSIIAPNLNSHLSSDSSRDSTRTGEHVTTSLSNLANEESTSTATKPHSQSTPSTRAQTPIADHSCQCIADDKSTSTTTSSSHRHRHNTLAQLLLQLRSKHLFYPLMYSDAERATEPKKFVLNVAAMQAYAVRLCQARVVEAAEGLLLSRDVDLDLPEIIHRYCEALRDMDYMQEKARNGFDSDPFLLTTSTADERAMMYTFDLLDYHMLAKLEPAEDEQHPRLPGVGRTARIHSAKRKEKLYNVLSALAGGLALLIPMVIMKLVPGRVCSLTTTCGCVLAVALVIAFGSNLKQSEILTITAAYAAVLVVFVGNNNTSDGGRYSR